MNFLPIWERVKNNTDLKKYKDLAVFIEVSVQYVSKKKQEDDFPIEWAYKIAQKYILSTDWILTGFHNFPKKINSDHEFTILNDLDQWLKELVIDEPFRKDWFKGNIEDAFPMFREWMKKREEEHGKNNISQNSKVA